MTAPKTVPTEESVEQFLASVADERRRTDAEELCALMEKATGTAPVMWGSSIVGFGSYHYRYGSGRVGEWLAVGFSPRKQALTVYLAEGLEAHGSLLAKLGPHTTGQGCLYVKRLSDVDKPTVRKLIGSVQTGQRKDHHHIEAEAGPTGQSPVAPSIRSRIRSAWPLCRAYSSII